MNWKTVNLKKLYFTSDTHKGHANIIKYCARPFSSVEEMDEELKWKWNNSVNNDDVVIHCGDIGFGNTDKILSWYEKLNGIKILILGNHDYHLNLNKIKKSNVFEEIYDSLFISLSDNQKIHLNHYPFMSWNEQMKGSWNIHGHVHTTFNSEMIPLVENQFDCGVDNNDYAPINYYLLKNKIKLKNEFIKYCKENSK